MIQEKIKIKVNPNSREYYNSIGYQCNNFDEIEIDTLDLPSGSNIEVMVKCDICESIRTIKFNRFYKNTKGNTTLYTCNKCCSYKVKKTKLERYGDENYQNTGKIKKTKLERYGDENYTNRSKAKSTCMEKYGEENVSKVEFIKEIRKNKNIENWGVENVFQSDKVKRKISKVVKEKYGTNQYVISKDCKDKYKIFCEKLGVDHYSQSNDFKEKFEATSLLNWGYKTNLLNSEIKNRIKETNLIKYGFESHTQNIEYSIRSSKRITDGRHDYYKSLGYELKSYDFNKKEYTLINTQCGHEFKINHDLFRSRIKYGNNSCLICYPKDELMSIKESELSNFISELTNNVELNSRKLIGGKEIDIYLPDFRLGIEFNGLYWHSDLFKDKFYHYNKTKQCIENNISLIHIWEDDWVNKKDIIKSIIKNRMGIISNKIYSRKCKIEIVSNKESNIFLNENHIQGGTNASLCISLKYNGEIVSLMTFGKRRTNSKLEMELIRFCNKKETSVIGSASKLFNFFIKTSDCDKIISYSDISMFEGKLYEKLGFVNDGETTLNYYWTDLNKRYHRFNFNKKKLIKIGYDPKKTEDQIMKDIGYYKIWSCGQVRWIFNKKKVDLTSTLTNIFIILFIVFIF